ncbi:ribokinase [Sphaerisporangium melleum]|uniref:Ribokinase n=1 Tax=Sphaerisporangium melleum TaxID=321316 RepID=A0A917R016_9ACTN|nr:sugar kinase [Sphaerisporangium melleum]GGK78731.1 ribokinase [Sphaerisporangium melleum]GII69785.1 ribokinase [Sphaerisporangium melleum]
MTEVFTLGEALGVVSADRLRHDSEVRLDVAGAEFTAAVGLARLGHAVTWLGRVGDDELGARVITVLRGEGVDISCAQIDPAAPTGLVVRQRRIGRVGHVVHYRGGSAGSRLGPGDIPARAVQAAKVLHITGVTPALSGTAWSAAHHAIKLAREAGVTVSVDVNHRPQLWVDRQEAVEALTELATGADVLFANQDELQLIEPAIGTVRELVVTRGGKGASATVSGMRYDAQAAPVTVVDPVGAGGAFVAGYLSGMLEELHPTDRLRRGAALAAFTVASPSPWQGLPTRSELPPLTF